MKTLHSHMMNKLFLTTLLITLSFPVFSQDTLGTEVLGKKEQRKLEREHKFSEKQADEAQSREITQQLVKNQRFILEADYVADRYGMKYPVTSLLNFIRIDSTNAIIQLGSNTGLGYNGVGGITVEGRVTKYKLSEKQNKKGTSYTITAYVTSSLGTYDLQFWVSQLGNADAAVRGNFPGSVTFTGHLVPIDESRVYKGTTTP